MTLEEVTRAGELVTKSLSPKVRIVWGARVDPTLEGRVKCMVMLTGVESTFLAQQQEYSFSFGPIKIGPRSQGVRAFSLLSFYFSET
jgi:cell division GTPase FtsZ